jgi:signal transduction histidine kinase
MTKKNRILKCKLTFIFLFSFSFSSLFSQLHSGKQSFDQELKKVARSNSKEINFQKAQSFFLAKEWDSTLVHSMKQLMLPSNTMLNDYCHYFRANSFKKKKMFAEAKREFELVSRTFPFFYKIKIGLGAIYLEQANYSKALSYFQAIEDATESCTYDYNRSSLLHDLGICHMELQHFDKAEKYLFKCVELQQMEKDTQLLVGSYMDIATLYYNQFKDNQAIPYFEKAYQLSKKVKSFEIKQNAAINMAVVEENRKHFLQSIAYRKEYETWKDSLNDQNKIWAVAEIEKKLAVKQKQNEVNVLQTENTLKAVQRNSLFYSSILLLLLLVVSIYFYSQKTKQNKVIFAQKEELNQLNATKDKLFSIVSHDLRSSVSALKTSNAKSLEGIKNNDLPALSHLLHNNSEIANGAYNLLDNLLNWAILQTKQGYFYKDTLHLLSIIEHVTYNYKSLLLNKNIGFENKVSANIFVMADQDSLKIIIRNALDNAVKFSKENGKISVYTHASDDDYCHLIIEDNGTGMSETVQQELLKETTLLSKKRSDENIGTGLGIQLCKSMIHKNGGRLEIESQEDIGTKIIIIVPKTENNG